MCFCSHILLRMIAIRYRRVCAQKRQISRIKNSWSTQDVCFYSSTDWDSATDLSILLGLRWCNLARWINFWIFQKQSDPSSPSARSVGNDSCIVNKGNLFCLVPDISPSWTLDEKYIIMIFAHTFTFATWPWFSATFSSQGPGTFEHLYVQHYLTFSHHFFFWLGLPHTPQKKVGQNKQSSPPKKKQPIKKNLYF